MLAAAEPLPRAPPRREVEDFKTFSGAHAISSPDSVAFRLRFFGHSRSGVMNTSEKCAKLFLRYLYFQDLSGGLLAALCHNRRMQRDTTLMMGLSTGALHDAYAYTTTTNVSAHHSSLGAIPPEEFETQQQTQS